MRTHGIERFDDLVRRSIEDPAWFWDAVVLDLDLEFSTPYGQIVDLSRGPAWATWFVGGSTNVARQCVDRWAERTPMATAVVWEGEDAEVRTATYRELRALTDAVARALMSFGVAGGDTVGIFLPMAIETVGDGDGVLEAGRNLGADLQRLRARRGRRATDGRGLPGLGHGERFPPKGRPRTDEGHRGPSDRDGRRCRPRARVGPPAFVRRPAARPGPSLVRRRGSRRRARRRDAPRRRAPLVYRLHERHDRSAEGRGPRPRRVPGEDRRGGGLPGRLACG